MLGSEVKSPKLMGSVLARKPRGWTLYLALAIFLFLFMDWKGAMNQVDIKIMNDLIPSFYYLRNYKVSDGEFDPNYLWVYIRYYNQLNNIINSTDISNILGYLYFWDKDYKKAEQFYQKAIKQDPKFFLPQFNLAELYYDRGDYVKALPLFKKCLSLDQRHVLMRLGNSKVYQQIFYGTEAWEKFLVRRVDEGYVLTYERIIQCFIQQKDFNSALRFIDKAVSKGMEKSLFFIYYKGVVLFNLNRYNEALECFKHVLQQDPKHKESMLAIARIAALMGQKEVETVYVHQAWMLHQLKQEDDTISKLGNEQRIF
ncbi:MAG: tetratricopeptide repeat protein [Candidatus Omnitrophica bacterium]|nr:tetratricopeptide repeat protein [Candidatus Omnitrophota bacterium]